MPDLASPLWQQPEHREAHAQTLKSLLGSVAERASGAVVGVHLLAVAQDDPDPDFDLARCSGCVDPHLITGAVPVEAVPSRPALFVAGIKLLEAAPRNEQSDGLALSREAAAEIFAGCGAQMITEQAMARIATWQHRGVDPPPAVRERHDRRAVCSDTWGADPVTYPQMYPPARIVHPLEDTPPSEGAGLQCARLDGIKGVVGAERLAYAFTERPNLLTVSVRGCLLPDTITADGAPLSHISAITAQRVQGINGEADTSSPRLVRDTDAEVSKR